MTSTPFSQSADNGSTDVENLVGFLLLADNLKDVERQNPLVSGIRRERTAEHSWHVAIAVLCLCPYASEPIDKGRAVELAIVHDLPELTVGDTFVYGSGAGSRRGREVPAISEITSRYAASAGPEIMKAWQDYEYEKTAEGRFVMAVDVLLPIFINLAAGDESSWAKHHVMASRVRARVAAVHDRIPLLADLASKAIDQGVARGLLQ